VLTSRTGTLTIQSKTIATKKYCPGYGARATGFLLRHIHKLDWEVTTFSDNKCSDYENHSR
jgi:hypothetical protein